VCGKPIDPKESRFVDKDANTKFHAHLQCKGALK
jgi:hypothetical protein